MRRLVLVLVVLAGCGRAASGPAWPRSAGTVTPDEGEEDGGESLAPRSSDHPAAAIEVSEDPTVAVVAIEPGAIVTPTPTPTPPPTSTPTPTPTGETMEIQIEEIIVTPGDGIIPP